MRSFSYPLDSSGVPFRYPSALISMAEKEKIRHEVNTNYVKYQNKRLCVHMSYGLDNRAYIYYFENRGFDDINIYERRDNDN